MVRSWLSGAWPIPSQGRASLSWHCDFATVASSGRAVSPAPGQEDPASPEDPLCEGGVDVVGVVTPLVRGCAQVLHGDQVVELSVLLEVQEKEEVEEDGEGQIEIESGE